MAKSRRLAQHVPMRTAWPVLEVLEPMSGDFGVLSPPLQGAPREHEEEFIQLYTEALITGIFVEEHWESWAVKSDIPIIPWIENCPIVHAQSILPVELMSNICEDYVPHIGLFIDDLFFAGEHHPDLRGLAGAVASTLPLLKHGFSPLYKISTQHPRLRSTLHTSLTAHHRTPAMLWKKSENGATPLLPIGSQYIPDIVDNLHTISSDVFIAKMISIVEPENNHNSRWIAHLVLEVPQTLEDILSRYLRIRLQIAWYRYRRHNNKICLEDILRERSDLLYRSVIEHTI